MFCGAFVRAILTFRVRLNVEFLAANWAGARLRFADHGGAGAIMRAELTLTAQRHLKFFATNRAYDRLSPTMRDVIALG